MDQAGWTRQDGPGEMDRVELISQDGPVRTDQMFRAGGRLAEVDRLTALVPVNG